MLALARDIGKWTHPIDTVEEDAFISFSLSLEDCISLPFEGTNLNLSAETEEPSNQG